MTRTKDGDIFELPFDFSSSSNAVCKASRECVVRIIGVRTNVPTREISLFDIGGSPNLMLDRLEEIRSGMEEASKERTHSDSSFLLSAFPILISPNQATLRFRSETEVEPWAKLICQQVGPTQLISGGDIRRQKKKIKRGDVIEYVAEPVEEPDVEALSVEALLEIGCSVSRGVRLSVSPTSKGPGEIDYRVRIDRVLGNGAFHDDYSTPALAARAFVEELHREGR